MHIPGHLFYIFPHSLYDLLHLIKRGFGAFRQITDLQSDYGKALSGFSRSRRFDRCIQRQQIGRIGNIADQL